MLNNTAFYGLHSFSAVKSHTGAANIKIYPNSMTNAIGYYFYFGFNCQSCPPSTPWYHTDFLCYSVCPPNISIPGPMMIGSITYFCLNCNTNCLTCPVN